MKTFDIFCALESWTRDTFDFNIHFQNCSVFHAPAIKLSRLGRLSGGVVVIVKNSIASFVTEIKTMCDNLISLRLSKHMLQLEQDLILTFTYVPPYQSSYYKNKDTNCAIDNLQAHYLNLTENELDCNFLLFGDLNARIGNWLPDCSDDEDEFYHKNDNVRNSFDLETNFYARNLKEFCTLFDLTPLNGNCIGDENGEYTFVGEQGQSVVDYALMSVNLYNNTTFCFHVNTSRVESDHCPIQFTMPIKYKKRLKKNSESKYITKCSWDPDKKDIFINNMSSPQTNLLLQKAEEKISNDHDIEDAVQKFNKALLDSAKCMQKRIKVDYEYKTGNQWFDRECAESKQAAVRAKRTQAKSKDPKDIAFYHKLKSEYKKERRDKRLTFRKRTKEELIREKKNGKKFWGLIKKMKRKKNYQPDITISDWKDYFQNLLESTSEEIPTTKIRKNYQMNDPSSIVNDSELDKEISKQEIQEAINNIKYGKSAGADQICGEFIKHSTGVIEPFLHKLFNFLFNNSIYPKIWNLSIITPIHKKGDKNKTDNYRGISLLSVVSKIFTSILHKRLYTWAEVNNKFCEEQAGFRRSFSTTDHIFTLVSMIKHRMQCNKGKVYAVFIDYKKAFDYVDRNHVWKKLKELNVSTKMLLILKEMYKSVESCVRWNGELSESFQCLKGVKQGCILSPLLFSLLINDVANYVFEKGRHGLQIIPQTREIFSLLFADDIVLLSSTPQGLQNQINNLAIKSKELGLEVNLEKTKIMVFRKGGFLGKREQWFYEGVKLDVVNQYKYLGYLITTKLSFEEVCDDISRKAKGKITDLFKTMWAIGNIDTNIFFQLFDCQIKPILLYGSEVWGGFASESIESAHLFALKRLLNVGEKTPNTLVYGETGRYSINIDVTLSYIKYWLKVMKLPISRFPRQVLALLYRTLDQIDAKSKQNWLTKVRDCLKDNGFSDVWEAGEVYNEDAFLRILKNKLIETFKLNWMSKLRSSDRFATYRLFKTEFGQELYLDDLTIKKFRDCLIRFRIGINELGINKRFQISNVQSKNCPFCENSLEDEEHFLFVCHAYNSIRNKYLIGNYEFENVLFLQDPNIDVKRKTAMYIFYSLKCREEKLINQTTILDVSRA